VDEADGDVDHADVLGRDVVEPKDWLDRVEDREVEARRVWLAVDIVHQQVGTLLGGVEIGGEPELEDHLPFCDDVEAFAFITVVAVVVSGIGLAIVANDQGFSVFRIAARQTRYLETVTEGFDQVEDDVQLRNLTLGHAHLAVAIEQDIAVDVLDRGVDVVVAHGKQKTTGVLAVFNGHFKRNALIVSIIEQEAHPVRPANEVADHLIQVGRLGGAVVVEVPPDNDLAHFRRNVNLGRLGTADQQGRQRQHHRKQHQTLLHLSSPSATGFVLASPHWQGYSVLLSLSIYQLALLISHNFFNNRRSLGANGDGGRVGDGGLVTDRSGRYCLLGWCRLACHPDEYFYYRQDKHRPSQGQHGLFHLLFLSDKVPKLKRPTSGPLFLSTIIYLIQ